MSSHVAEYRPKSMKEDCATGMSASQGCTDDKAVVESFKEALEQRVGADRYRMWFIHGVSFALESGVVVIRVRGEFALSRMKKNFLRELRSAAMTACNSSSDVRLDLVEERATQVSLLPEVDPCEDVVTNELANANHIALTAPGKKTRSNPTRGSGATSGPKTSGPKKVLDTLPGIVTQSPAAQRSASSSQMSLALSEGGSTPSTASKALHTLSEFITGRCNQLACAATTMVCQNPQSASPLFLFGSTGVGKTHLLHAVADQFRRYHRMRHVMVLTAEQFTNDFISSVGGGSGLPAFRRRYREVDALLIDDVHFLDSKRATLREMLFTVETLSAAGRPLVFTANQSPTEISGLTRELAGRMAAGLVCPIQPLDAETRKKYLQRLIAAACPIAWPDEVLDELNVMLGGDARMCSGIVNLVGMLQRMYSRMPTMNEIREFGGDVLRSQSPTVTLAAIERAVCETFGLQQQSLREGASTRSITEPRMLAMYLSRQLTSAAYNEISRHYNQKSHTSAILAGKKVEQWIQTGKPLGRGPTAMSARQALDRIESILRAS